MKTKPRKKKQVKNNFVIVAILFSVVLLITGIAYYYAQRNKILVPKINMSMIYFYLTAIVVGVGSLAHIFIFNKKNFSMMAMLFGPGILFLALAIIQPFFFRSVEWTYVVLKTLGAVSAFVIVSVSSQYFIKRHIEEITLKSLRQVMTAEEVQQIAACYLLLSVAFPALTFVITEGKDIFETILLVALFGLGTGIFSLVQYRSMKKNFLASDDDVLFYRYYTLQSKVYPKQLATTENLIAQTDHAVEEQEAFIASRMSEKNDFVELKNERPAYEKENERLIQELSQYNYNELKQKEIVTIEQLETVKTEMWEQKYAKDAANAKQEKEIAQERLQEKQAELTQTIEKQSELETLFAQNEIHQEEELVLQDEKKTIRSKISDAIDKLYDTLNDESLDEDEVKKIEVKIAKQQKREASVDDEIEEIQNKISELQGEHHNLENDIASIVKTTIPDLTYVIETTEQLLTDAKEKVTIIDDNYQRDLEMSEEIISLKDSIATLANTIEVVEEFQSQQAKVAEILAVDTEKEIETIDVDVENAKAIIAQQLDEKETYQNEATIFEQYILDTESILSEYDAMFSKK